MKCFPKCGFREYGNLEPGNDDIRDSVSYPREPQKTKIIYFGRIRTPWFDVTSLPIQWSFIYGASDIFLAFADQTHFTKTHPPL